MISDLIIYALLCSSCFYLGSRAKVTSFLWSRYPPKLAAFMDCAACTGFWWGAAWWLILSRFLPGIPTMSVASPIIHGLIMIVLTPIVAGLMQAGLERLGSAVEINEE